LGVQKFWSSELAVKLTSRNGKVMWVVSENWERGLLKDNIRLMMLFSKRGWNKKIIKKVNEVDCTNILKNIKL